MGSEASVCGGRARWENDDETFEQGLFASRLRPGHRLLAAASALSVQDLRRSSASSADGATATEPELFDLVAVGVVQVRRGGVGGDDGGGEAALMGLQQDSWFSYRIGLVIPLCRTVGQVFVVDGDSDGAAAAPPHRFRVALLRAAKGTAERSQQQAFAQALASQLLVHKDAIAASNGPKGLRSVVTDGFPCPSGAFDWMWSYAPPAIIPGGLAAEVTTPASPCQAPSGQPALSLLAVTLNCAGASAPSPEALVPLFADAATDAGNGPAGGAGAGEGEERRRPPRPAEVVVAALQEACPLYLAFAPGRAAEDEAADAWTSALEAALLLASAPAAAEGGGRDPVYTRVFARNLVGLVLVIWALVDKAAGKTISDAAVGCEVRCGAFGAGNKGAVAVSLRLWDPHLGERRLCAANVHLAAGEGEGAAEKRARDVDEMLQRLRFADAGGGGGEANVFEHDLVLWIGDFNSRSSSPSQLDDGLPSAREFSEQPDLATQFFTKSGDEVAALRAAHRGPWALLEEAPICFGPTYGLAHDEEAYDSDGLCWRSRHPAWCDRIFWWARPACVVASPAWYRRVGEVCLSDHRPVSLCLDLWPAAPGSSVVDSDPSITTNEVRILAAGASRYPPPL